MAALFMGDVAHATISPRPALVRVTMLEKNGEENLIQKPAVTLAIRKTCRIKCCRDLK